MRKIKAMKKRSSAGFTLAETLMAILILMMVSVIVANGVPAARNAYDKVVVGANAKVLLSTTISALRDELSTALPPPGQDRIDVDSVNKSITYFSADDGATAKIYLADNIIMLQEYIDDNPIPSTSGTAALLRNVEPRALVAKKAATADMFVRFSEVSLSKSQTGGTDFDTITFTGLEVCRASDSDKALASVDTLTIRLIKPVTPET